MNDTNPKKIHRKLLFRISLMGLLVALLSGAVVWQFEKQEIDRSILIKSESGFKRLNNQVRHLLNDPGRLNPQEIDRQLVTLLSRRDYIRIGLFVWIGLYDLQGKPVARIPDETYEHIEQVAAVTGGFLQGATRYGKMSIDIIELNRIPHIRIVAPLSNDRGEVAAYGETVFAVSEEAIAAIRTRALKLALAAMGIVLLTTALTYPVVNTLLIRVTALSARLFEANLEILTVLGSAIAKRDSDTDAHNYRVTIISVKLAERMGLTDDSIRRLIKGAFLHDVGKIGIDDRILHKPGRLSDAEFEVMQSHVSLGLDIVNKAEWIRDAMDIVGCHHEKYDGSGYGNGMAGNRIPENARIFAIVDVFDALTSRRPYKDPFSLEKTMHILEEGRDRHFDPACLDAFKTLSRSIYDTYAGREDDALKSELNAIIKKYFYG